MSETGLTVAMHDLCDTSKECREMLASLLRKASPASRMHRVRLMSNAVIRNCRRHISRQNPALSDDQIGIEFVRRYYGSELAEKVHAFYARRTEAA